MSESAPYRSLLTIDEAAAYLNVPARWAADAVRQRKVRCTRIGKHVRFRVEHLEELVAAGEAACDHPCAAARCRSPPSTTRRALSALTGYSYPCPAPATLSGSGR